MVQRRHFLGVGTLLAAALLAPASAQAQFRSVIILPRNSQRGFGGFQYFNPGGRYSYTTTYNTFVPVYGGTSVVTVPNYTGLSNYPTLIHASSAVMRSPYRMAPVAYSAYTPYTYGRAGGPGMSGCGYPCAAAAYAADMAPVDPPRMRQANYTPSASAARDERATIAQVQVQLPCADAELWVEGERMNLDGTHRLFVSPPLNPDSRYAYEIVARWQEGGQTRTRSRNVEVHAGNTVQVDMTAQ